MPPPTPERPARQTHSSSDLPYGRLPPRPDQATPEQPASSRADPVRLQMQPEAAPGAAGEQAGSAEQVREQSSELEVAAARGDADDDVHFGVAAKALGVSRKTVERMVKRGQLERGPSGASATVSKRALVAVLEQRRQDVNQVTSADELQPHDFGEEHWRASFSQDAPTGLEELLRPVLAPLLDEFVAARTRAAVLETQIEGIKARAAQERARDELLLALATGGWLARRRARRAALHHYVLRDHPAPPG